MRKSKLLIKVEESPDKTCDIHVEIEGNGETLVFALSGSMHKKEVLAAIIEAALNLYNQ